MPKLTGTPISSAMPEVTSVPIDGHQGAELLGDRVPFAESTRKPEPNFCIAGRLPYTSDTMMPTRIASTRKAKSA